MSNPSSASHELSLGEAIVLTAFWHPVRGHVECPGARLLAGTLARAGLRTHLREIVDRETVEAASVSGSAVSFTVDGGTPVGLGAVASNADAEAAEVIRRCVGEWTAVLRTRLLLASTYPAHCGGVERFVEAFEALSPAAASPLYAVGVAGCGQAVADRITAGGGRLSLDLPAMEAGATLVIGPAGAPERFHQEAAARGVAMVDGTCTLVAAARSETSRISALGEQVVLTGRQDAAATPCLAEAAGADASLAEGVLAARRTLVADPEHVGVVAIPGQAVGEALATAQVLRERFGHVIPQRPSSLCFAADDRRDTVRALAACAELVLVAAASPRDPDASQVARWATDAGAQTRVVERVEDIEAGWLAKASAVAVAETVNAPDGLATELLTALRGLGPNRLVRRSTVTVLEPDGPPGSLPYPRRTHGS